ncbi:MAG: ATP-binding protein [Firmicutes bacterium]|nr:ATP-binding protein [Bacillota bacterium]
MFPRALANRVTELLQTMPAVLLQGARQVGKTTLAKQLIQTGVMQHYFSFDDPVLLSAATQDPVGFVRELPPRSVLDEVQRVLPVLPAIKLRIDAHREVGDLLLTGSANPMMLPRLSETLVGRMATVTLMPLTQGEIEGRQDRWVESLFSDDFSPRRFPRTSDLLERVERGGYPEAVLRSDARERVDWLAAYIDTLLARDVREIADIERLAEVPRLLQLLAAQACQTLNVAALSQQTGVPQTTLQRYLTLLETLFLWTRVPAWFANLGKRLLKSPKILVNDTGIACMLLGVDAVRLATDPLLQGRMVENFVGMELLKQIGFSRQRLRLYHFRTDRGEEVDFLIEAADGTLVGVEVKASATVNASHFKGLRTLQSLVGNSLRRGIVLYWGEQTVPFGEGLWAQPVSALWCSPD